MATPISPLPDLSQYNYDIGDTTQVVVKQNAINQEIEQLGQNINTTIASINDDVDFIEGAAQTLDAAQIVHAPNSGLPNEAGTAYAADVVTGDGDETPARLVNNSRLIIYSRDKERQQLEAASGGLCTIERTTNGQACHMFVLPKTRWEDLLPGQELGTGVHEAFLENGVEKSELLIGMYMAAEINGEMVSQPRTTGRRSIDWDESVAAAKSAGFELLGNWEWSAVAFWCMANGYQPTGNTDFGRSHSDTYQRGVYDDDSVSNEYTLLGSGPNEWNHNNAANGIADLVGNRWEWVRGFKMVDGRIFLAPDNDPSLTDSAWADSGYDLPGNADPWSSATQVGATQQVQRALIAPNGVTDPDGQLYANLSGEHFPLRGGNRFLAAGAGLGALSLGYGRDTSFSFIGLRLSRLV